MGLCHATILETFHLREQATTICVCKCIFTMATAEEVCPVEGGPGKGGLSGYALPQHCVAAVEMWTHAHV